MYVDHHQLFPPQFDAVWSLDGNLQYDPFLHIYERQVRRWTEIVIFQQIYLFPLNSIETFVHRALIRNFIIWSHLKSDFCLSQVQPERRWIICMKPLKHSTSRVFVRKWKVLVVETIKMKERMLHLFSKILDFHSFSHNPTKGWIKSWFKCKSSLPVFTYGWPDCAKL